MSFRGQLIKAGIDSNGTDIEIFDGSLTLNEDNKLIFRDSGCYIYSNADGYLTIEADTGLIIAAAFSFTGTLTVGTAVTGIDFTGDFTNTIKFSSYTPDSDGSSGAALLRAGTYTVPLTESTNYQGGIFRMYLETSGVSSYNKGAFICLKTTGAKGIHGVCSLVEVLAQAVAGPTSVYAGQFVAHLNSATAKIASGGGLPELVGIWTKITSEVGSTIAASTRACALWVDNQLNGTVSGEEYGIFATCGGSKVDAFIGFETTSSGWTNLFYFDETAYDQDPVGTATVSGGTADKYLKVSLNGTAYGIQLYAI
uniref:Uncharacterized protein n=1 Tax=viral metagenome TaxID=1070528 RepID=A0A6M3J0M8_9ZZZZ